MACTGQYRVLLTWITDLRDGSLAAAASTQQLSLTGRRSPNAAVLLFEDE